MDCLPFAKHSEYALSVLLRECNLVYMSVLISTTLINDDNIRATINNKILQTINKIITTETFKNT